MHNNLTRSPAFLALTHVDKSMKLISFHVYNHDCYLHGDLFVGNNDVRIYVRIRGTWRLRHDNNSTNSEKSERQAILFAILNILICIEKSMPALYNIWIAFNVLNKDLAEI